MTISKLCVRYFVIELIFFDVLSISITDTQKLYLVYQYLDTGQSCINLF